MSNKEQAEWLGSFLIVHIKSVDVLLSVCVYGRVILLLSRRLHHCLSVEWKINCIEGRKAYIFGVQILHWEDH